MPEDPMQRAKRLMGEAEPDSTGSNSPAFLPYVLQQAAVYYRQAEPLLSWMWRYGAYPISHWVWPAAKWMGKNYWRFLKWAVRKVDPETGNAYWSYQGVTAAAMSSVLLLGGVWFGLGPAFSLSVRTVYDAGMYLTEKQKHLYVLGADTLEEGTRYSIQACRALPCTENNTIHFHVEKDVVYGIWYPEDIYDAVPQETSWGSVTYTGWRVKLLGWYPEVKRIELTPISELPPNHPAKSHR